MSVVLLHKPLSKVAKAILRRYSGSLWTPSASTCFSDSAGTTPAVQDGGVGRIVCSTGSGIYASQSTTGYQPNLRKGAKNWLLNSDWALGTVDGSPGTAPANWTISYAPTGVTRTIAHGTDAYGKYLEVRYAGTNTSGSVGNTAAISSHLLTPSAIGLTWTGQSKVALVGGAWPADDVHLNIQETASGTHLYSTRSQIKTLATSSVPYRASVTRTTDQGTLTHVRFAAFFTSIAIGETVDFTVRVYDPMLEVGSTASPYVATTAAPASNGVGSWWLDFDGLDDRLALSAVPFQMADDHFVVGVAKPLSVAAQSDLFHIASTASNTPRIAGLSVMATNGYARASWSDDAAAVSSHLGTTGLLATTAVLSARAAGSLRALRTNATTTNSGSVSLGATTVNAAAIGCLPVASPIQFFNGAIYAVALGKGTITDSEIKLIEKYLGTLSGVVIS